MVLAFADLSRHKQRFLAGATSPAIAFPELD